MNSALQKNDGSAKLLLLLSSFSIYAFQFRTIFFQLNKVLSSVTLDSIKNYYTFVYHVKNDSNLLRFDGMNYPFSEHVIYSDCQPILAGICKLLPFLSNHLIGVMHLLMFASFIVSPLILFSILRRAQLSVTLSFIISLAIALLAPQFLKINAGHFALAYGCIIPYSILLQQGYFTASQKMKAASKLFCYNVFIFLLHPYMGMCLSLFTGLSMGINILLYKDELKNLHSYLQLTLAAALPILLFSVFMKVSDTHQNRTSQPYGSEVMVENIASLAAPDFGPFKAPLEKLLPAKPFHFEGHSYLGIVSSLSSLLLLILLPFNYKKVNLKDASSLIFYASLFILLISFGLHQKLLKAFDINSSAVNQFRAVCRFAWVFYYTLPLFVFLKLNEIFKQWQKPRIAILQGIAGVYLLVNLVESNAMFHLNESAYWKFRNFFNEALLTPTEKALLKTIETKKPSAILPLPIFHGGSEMYDRNGASNSMAPAMMLSFHTGLPIYSVMMSRTSVTETEDEIELFNLNHSKRRLPFQLKDKSFLVVKTNDALLPDEERILPYISFFANNDSLKFGTLAIANLQELSPAPHMQNLAANADSLLKQGIVYIREADRTPFVNTLATETANAFTLDSFQIKTGRYVISLHYHYSKKKSTYLSTNLIITEGINGNYSWKEMRPIRKVSGIYDDYLVYEDFIALNTRGKYEFLFMGTDSVHYHISDFLLRPDTTTVFRLERDHTNSINNFARK